MNFKDNRINKALEPIIIIIITKIIKTMLAHCTNPHTLTLHAINYLSMLGVAHIFAYSPKKSKPNRVEK